MAVSLPKNKPGDLRLFDGRAREVNPAGGDTKQFWASLFKPDLYHHLEGEDTDIFGILMLLQTALETVKQVGSRCTSLSVSYKSSLQELQESKEECTRLRDNIKSLQNSPCRKCPTLITQLKEANKKAEEAQSRMHCIARILMGGEDKKSQNAEKCGNTATLVTQMLLGTSESPKRKKRLTLNKTEKKDNADVEIIVPETMQPYSCNVQGPGLEVPESIYEEQIEQPQTKNPSPITMKTNETTKNPKPVCNEKKTFSTSVNIPLCGSNVQSVPKKNLTAGLENLGKENQESPVKEQLNFNLKMPWKEKGALEGLNNSLTVEEPRRNSELERIWFSDQRDVQEDGVKGNEKLWKLKEVRGCTGKETTQGGRKRLKQMTLGVRVKEKKKDVSQMEGFVGGNSHNVDTSSQDEEVDIVLPSPKGKLKNLRKKKKSKTNSVNVNLFAPLATSTQLSSGPLDNSFDKFPEKKKESPNYKYKRETVRGKERQKLEGRQCEECGEYYRAAGLSPGELQERLNVCSRHREKYPREKSPLGFWDPVMPDTQECKERGFYTSVIYKKEPKK